MHLERQARASAKGSEGFIGMRSLNFIFKCIEKPLGGCVVESPGI